MVIVAYALTLLAQMAGSADPLPPVETYEFLREKEGRCRIEDKEWTPECEEISEPRLFRGVWIIEFEGVRFTPSEQVDCEDRSNGILCMSLEGDQLPSAEVKGRHCPVFELKFVGRRTVYPGPHGEFGMPAYKVIVDRMISAKRLPTKCGRWGDLVRILKPKE